jgi:hypothetical protein
VRRSGATFSIAALLMAGAGSLALLYPESPKYATRVERKPVPGEREPIESARAPAALLSAYRAERARHRDIDYATLEKELAIRGGSDPELGFDPEQALFFDRIAKELLLDPDEKALYRENGLVNVDHAQRYSMGSAYYAIYARDLPVFVTSDSILHALHRSYDELLKALETELFVPALSEALLRAHEELERSTHALGPALGDSARDVDVYLAVARSLLRGRGLTPEEGRPSGLLEHLEALAAPNAGALSRLGQGEKVEELVRLIVAAQPGQPERPIELNGGTRAVDFSQFRPRGHYTESPDLGRYFRTMMWLGRADTGFILAPPDERSALVVDSDRELRSAALLAFAAGQGRARKHLLSTSRALDFLMGRSDSVGLDGLLGALERAGIRSPSELASEVAALRLRSELGRSGEQAIRSQIIVSPPDGTRVPTPELFQLMGQRFGVDSFVLSEVVFDSIEYEGRKPERRRPSGLDVMAALGNDEAVKLLKPELEEHDYSSNLLALRRTIDERAPGSYPSDLYSSFLDVLRTLDDVPGGAFPSMARREPWRRKQLQTQLASWSELRHDTILYTKQSYTAWPSCGYPAAFVEPYPEFFAKLGLLADTAVSRFATLETELATPEQREVAKSARERAVGYFRHFGAIMAELRGLAEKELREEPFSAEEELFLKKTIDRRGGGSGAPRYDGWYATLFFAPDQGGEIDLWKPVVSDVHTNPIDREVLQEGVGDVNFLVVAVDNGGDRVAYVGPVYSYYEFWSPIGERLTDEAFRQRIESGNLPPRPRFTQAFVTEARHRGLGPRIEPKDLDDPKSRRIAELYALYRSAAPAERERLYREMKAVQSEAEIKR